MVLRRFIGLYGKHKSDNGTNFAGTERKLRQPLDELENSDTLKRMTEEEGYFQLRLGCTSNHPEHLISGEHTKVS